MRKKICAYILLTILTLISINSPIAVFAETMNVTATGVTKISSHKNHNSYDDSVGKPITKQSNSGGSLIAMNGYDWVEFSVNTAEEGYYSFIMAIANSANNFAVQKYDLSVNGEMVHKATATAGQGWSQPVENFVGVLKLAKGENIIKIYATQASMYLFYVKLEKLTDSNLGDVELSTNQGVCGKAGYLTFSENSTADLNLKEHDDGFYKITFNAKAETSSTINISSSGITKGMLNVKSNGFYDYGLYCDLKSDDTVLNIAGLKGNFDFTEIKIIKLSDDAKASLYEFKDRVNNASSVEEVKQAVNDVKDILHPDGAYLKNLVFYDSDIYKSLLNGGYKSEQEVTNAYFDAVAKEISNPKIKLFSGDEQITEIKNGTLKFEVNAKDMNVKSVVIGIYSGKQLKYVGLGSKGTKDTIKIYIQNVSLDETQTYETKVLFLENINSIKPHNVNVFEEIYVDPSGSDVTGDGSQNAPFATIKRAKERVAEISDSMNGDIIVNIASGTYTLTETEVFDESHGGKNGFRVYFRGYGDSKPEVIGGEKITDWSLYKDGIYKAPLDYGKEVRNLYVNGYQRTRAHGETLYEVREYYDDPNLEGARNGFVIYPYQFPEKISEPENLEVVVKTWWVSQRVSVDNLYHYDDEVIFVTDSWYYPEGAQSTTAVNAGKKFYIENAIELLDEPGEFYYSEKDKMMYYYPLANENIGDCEIFVPKTETLIDVSGSNEQTVKNISFENLDIKYGAWSDVSDKGIMFVQADKISAGGNLPSLVPGQFKMNYADGITIENCNISCMESAGIAMTDGVHNVKINGNILRDLSGSGIIVGTSEHTQNSTDAKRCKNISITNNVITRVATEHMGCVGISAYYEKGIDILNNTIKETPYTGIHVGWGWMEGVNYDFGYYNISNNHIEDAMCILDDGAHIYTLGPLSGSIISNNYLKTSGADYGGVYCDTGSSELNIFENVIDDVSHAFSRWKNQDADIRYKSNYSVIDLTRHNNGSVAGIGDITVFDPENKPEEVEAIIEKAGVLDEYSQLLDEAALPNGEIDNLKDTPDDRISWKEYYVPVSSKKTAEINALYYIDTYHSDGYQNIVNNSGTPYIVYNRNEWVTYRINVLEEGTYKVSTLYSSHTTSTNTAMGVSVDGKRVLTGCKIPSLSSWSEWAEGDLGNLTLSKGTHEITFKVENGGFHMRYFMLNKIN